MTTEERKGMNREQYRRVLRIMAKISRKRRGQSLLGIGANNAPVAFGNSIQGSNGIQGQVAPQWYSLSGVLPFVTVTANGGPGGDGGSYGPNTPGTTTGGGQEAINHVEGLTMGGSVVVLTQLNYSLTINKPNISLIGVTPAGNNQQGYSGFPAAAINNLTIDSTNNALYGVTVGYIMVQTFTFTLATNVTVGFYGYYCGVNVNSTSEGLYFLNGSSFMSNSVFEGLWFNCNANSTVGITHNNANGGFGQVWFVNCSWSLTGTSTYCYNQPAGAITGTDLEFRGGSIYQSSSATSAVLFGFAGNTFGCSIHHIWMEQHAAMTYCTVSPSSSNVKHVHIHMHDNHISVGAGSSTVLNNTNTSFFGEENTFTFEGNLVDQLGGTLTLGTAGQQNANIPSYWRVIVRNNPGLFATTNILANYVDTTNVVFGLFGTGTSITASTKFLVCGNLIVTASCTTAITIYDKSGTQINAASDTTLNMRYIPDGYMINFGTGTVTVTAVCIQD